MNELLDKLAEMDRLLLDKLCVMKNPQYLKAVTEARQKLNEAQTLIALANK